MTLSQTYNYQAHPVSGGLQIERTGYRKAQEVNQAAGKPSRDQWSLKHECEAQQISNSIQLMSRNEMRAAKRKRK